jgi:hypothetical protein
MTETVTWRDLQADWQSRGRLDEAGQKAMNEYLEAAFSQKEDPWYLRGLVGVAAWVAAGCFVSFLKLVNLIEADRGVLFWGVLFLATAAGIRRATARVFPSQLALALGSAGQGLAVAWGTMTYQDSLGVLGGVTVFQGLATVVMYGLYRDTVYRFLAPLVTLGFAAAWILSKPDFHYLLHALIGLETLGVAVILVYGRGGRSLGPLGYSLAAAGPGSILILTLYPDVHVAVGPSSALIALGLVGLVFWLAEGSAGIRREWLFFALGGILFLAVFTTPGLLFALGLLILGYARFDGLLTWLGLLFLGVFLAAYYYDLNVVLAYKSYVLAGSGLVLLFLRALVRRRPWAGEMRS